MKTNKPKKRLLEPKQDNKGRERKRGPYKINYDDPYDDLFGPTGLDSPGMGGLKPKPGHDYGD